MKILGKLYSNRGHNEVDYLVSFSAREMKWLRKVSNSRTTEKGDVDDTTRVQVIKAIRGLKIYEKLPPPQVTHT